MRRRDDVDGLRGIAVLSVLLFHFGGLFGQVPGSRNPFLAGFLGVDMFFVISGYLITGLLVREWQKSGTVRLRGFWRRRIRRLFPALAVMLMLHALYWIASGRGPGIELRADAWIVPDLANFGKLQNDLHQGTGHTWSLAIEEQFYLLWPPILLVCLRLGGLRLARVVAIVLIVASVVVTVLWWEHNHDWNQGYLQTWSRVCELLIGGMVGLAVGRWRPPGWLRLAAAAGLGVLLVFTDASDPWLYRDGGMAGVSLLVAVLVAPPRGGEQEWGTRALSVAPLRWCGHVSYSLYLYSVPVEFVFLEQLPLSWGPWPRVIFSGIGTFALSYASYRWVELPLQVNALGKAPRWYVAGRRAAPLIAAAAASIGVFGLAHSGETTAAIVVGGLALIGTLALAATTPGVRTPRPPAPEPLSGGPGARAAAAAPGVEVGAATNG